MGKQIFFTKYMVLNENLVVRLITTNLQIDKINNSLCCRDYQKQLQKDNGNSEIYAPTNDKLKLFVILFLFIAFEGKQPRISAGTLFHIMHEYIRG